MKKAYYILGADGSGKTTFLKELERVINENGMKTTHIWIRSPKIFSKPLMAYCRMTGLTKYKIINGIRYGKHEFYKSKFVSWLFPILQLFDFKIKYLLNRRKMEAGNILLFDRFNLDTLADIMVDTRNYNLHKTGIGRKFIELSPVEAELLVLNVDEAIIRSRKKDTLFDEHLSYKVEVYKKLAEDLNIKVINNNKDFESVKKEVFKYFRL